MVLSVLVWVDRGVSAAAVVDGLAVGRAPYRFKQSSSSSSVSSGDSVAMSWYGCCSTTRTCPTGGWCRTRSLWFILRVGIPGSGTCSGGSLLPGGTLLCGSRLRQEKKCGCRWRLQPERPLLLSHTNAQTAAPRPPEILANKSRLCAPLPAKIRRQICSKQSSLLSLSLWSRNVSPLFSLRRLCACEQETLTH